VEFEADGKKRWVDTTLKGQGGGPFNRVISDFAVGLPVDSGSAGLVSAPKLPEQSDSFELQETILLDTSGGLSLLAVVQQCEGGQADIMRQELAKDGLEEMAGQRLKSITHRFHSATRVGQLQQRDDRAANKFVLAEVFEVNPLFGRHPDGQLCRYELPTHWIAGVLVMPEKTARTTPFALPHPCRISYTVDVESLSIRNMAVHDPRSQLSSPFLNFSRRDKAGNGSIFMKLSIETKAGYVPASQIEEHRQLIERVWQASNRELSIFKGYARPRQRRGFGELPFVSNNKLPATPALPPPAVAIVARPALDPTPSPSKRKRPKQHSSSSFPIWLKIGLAAFIVFWLLMMFLIKYRPLPRG